jgi:hypothetical protein
VLLQKKPSIFSPAFPGAIADIRLAGQQGITTSSSSAAVSLVTSLPLRLARKA